MQRYDVENFDCRGVDGQHPVYAMWHESIPTGSTCHRNRGLTVLISRHNDGELITRIIESQGYRTVRGSTSRGGVKALRELLRLGAEPSGLVMTPDGPRGPAHSVAPGALFLAAMTGRPLVAVGFAASRRRRAKSWDRMIFPKLFARVAVVYAAPLVVPKAAARDPQQLMVWEQRLQAAFEFANLRAHTELGVSTP